MTNSNAIETLEQQIADLNEQIERANEELKIEASLDRVRAVAMSMKKPDDLLSICEVLFAELELLGIKELRNAMVNIYDDNKNTFLNYDFSGSLGQSITVFSMIDTHPVPDYITKQIRQAKSPFAEIALTGDQLADWIGFREKNGELPDPKLKNASTLCYYFYSVETAAIGISTLSSITKREHGILKRFRNVFDLAYKRYTDIRQAEAQAREAEIQLALERVRARTMAMRHSDELTEVVKLLYQEFDRLKINNESTDIEIGLINEETGIAKIWAHFYLSDGTISTFKLPLTYIEEINNEFNIWKATPAEKRNEIFLTTVFSGELSEKFIRITEDFPELAEIFRPLIEAKITNWVTHNAYFSHGFLTLQGTEAYSSEVQEIQKRFAKVFEQTYTRFLDLQKAEAQAREAQIEAGLERVRSRSLAMHKTSELQEVIHTVHKELLSLNIAIHGGSFIAINSDIETELRCWGSGGTANTSDEVHLPLYEKPFCTNLISGIKNGPGFFTEEYTQQEKKEFFTFLFNYEPWSKLDAKQKNETLSSPGGYTRSCCASQHTSIFIINHYGEKFSGADNDILKRFGKVFEQAYTRFLDLQKAEAQTREAQIETGLERVRSKTMAMHKSEEVTGVAVSLNEELMKLGFQGGSTIIIIDKDTGDTEQWTGFSEDKTLKSCYVPYFKHPFHDVQLDAWKKGEKFLVQTITGEEKKTLDEHYFSTGYKDFPENDKKWMRAMESVTFSYAFMKYGAIHWGPDHLTEEQLRILQRFSKVFEQSYTRFLDLKKAEAQAREAQIEAALEKVRSRSLAMHKSEEMREMVKVVFERLKELNFAIDGGVFIGIPDTSTNSFNLWVGDDHAEYPTCFNLPYHDAAPIADVWRATQDGSDFLSKIYSKEEKNKWFYFAFKHTDFKILPDQLKDWILQQEFLTQTFSLAKHSGIGIHFHHSRELSDAEIDILKRFTKVFEQGYIRFLDLQKAEAQAREAQIEAAVEKVRSRSLAMHKSDELQEVVHTVFERLKELNVDFYTAIIVLFTESSKDLVWWLESKANQQYPRMSVPFTPIKFFNDLFEIKEKGADLLSKCYSFDEKNELFNHLFGNTGFKYVPENQKQFLMGAEFATISVALARNTGIHISSYSKRSFSDQDNQIIKRFANVFDQAYTRFLDLQKAEAQAREAEIELALERVRARTMAMQSPTEFVEVINVIGGQFMHLGFDIEWANFGANGLDIADGIDTWNFAVVPGADPVSSRLFIPRFEHPLFIEAAEQLASYRKTGNDLFVMTYGKDDKDLWLDHLFTKTIFKDVPEEYRAIQYAKPGYTTSNLALKDTFLSIGKFDPISFTEEQHAILRRFGNAFGLAYTRFLDLQKAEAQAREAQIEAALERVRSRTMGMQRSEELPQAANLLFQQIESLGIPVFSTGYNIWNEDKTAVTSWMSSQGIIQLPFHLPLTEESALVECYTAAQRGDTFFVQELSGEKLSSHLGYMSSLPVVGELMKKMSSAGISIPDHMINHHAFFSQGYLLFISYQPVPEAYEIFKRFAKVFEQTYTRFLDLQKAEAQTREAQIEVAVERVRAKALAMHKSEDLHSVVVTLKKELMGLQIPDITAATMYLAQNDGSIRILDLSDTGTEDDDKPHLQLDKVFRLEETDPDLWIRRMWNRSENYFVLEADEADFVRVVEWLRTHDPAGAEMAENIIKEKSIKKAWLPTVKLEKGVMNIDLLAPPSPEIENILLKMGAGFDLAYKRFLDLQKAEAQAREAQIEAALERVRSKAMAMQNSTDLNALISHLFEETTRLDFVLDRCIVLIVDPLTLDTTWILSNPETPAEPSSHVVKYHEHKPYLYCLDAWKKRIEKWEYVLEGEEKKKWDQFLFYQTELSKLPVPAKEAMQNFSSVRLNSSFSNFGSITLASFEPLSESQYDILIKFTKVFDLTYTRFNDLKQAEAQAREAKIETALERVRARALAMQEPEELKEVAQVLRNEMGALGVEELETCSIYIHEKDSETAECWYALRDPKETEKKMVADHFHLELNDTWVGREMKKFYSSDEKQTSIVMQGVDRKEWINYCYKHSPVFSGFYGETIPDRTYHLYKFSHGYIGAAAPGDISAESWRLLSRAASVFSLAYSRFKDLTQARNDLIKLKEEKKRAEDALTELQATQKQLIQSEKMASLGELTAGIAHEIQNPLNFVNNFSDVSNELIEELKIKNEKLKIEDKEVKELLNDISQNLEKINHHGKRADAIVKGMLQHSRSSSGQKELTDINTLAEEYIRLAYHGLRAKDKFFNAKFETELDPSLNKINIVPQEIGRVILNLINNSFYAVSEKKKNTGNGYEPMVTISTKAVKPPPAGGGLGVVEISVKDNGNGIPQKMLDKIFQPFFTTKPTGQGTGLGLSLSYDIITKGHNGEIKVETKEGEGSVFTITLPMN